MTVPVVPAVVVTNLLGEAGPVRKAVRVRKRQCCGSGACSERQSE